MFNLISPPDSAQPAVVTQAATSADTPTPTVTHYQQLADELMKALDALKAGLPGLQASHADTRKFVKHKLNVPRDFLATAVATVEQSPGLQGLNKLDIVAGRDTLQFIDAFRTVLDKVSGLADDLRFTVESRQAFLATDALQIYAIAKGVSRDPGDGEMLKHVQNLKRDLARKGPKKGKKTAPTPTPIPPVGTHPVVTQATATQ